MGSEEVVLFVEQECIVLDLHQDASVLFIPFLLAVSPIAAATDFTLAIIWFWRSLMKKWKAPPTADCGAADGAPKRTYPGDSK